MDTKIAQKYTKFTGKLLLYAKAALAEARIGYYKIIWFVCLPPFPPKDDMTADFFKEKIIFTATFRWNILKQKSKITNKIDFGPKTSPSAVSRKVTQNAAVKSDFRATATHFVNIFAFLWHTYVITVTCCLYYRVSFKRLQLQLQLQIPTELEL